MPVTGRPRSSRLPVPEDPSLGKGTTGQGSKAVKRRPTTRRTTAPASYWGTSASIQPRMEALETVLKLGIMPGV